MFNITLVGRRPQRVAEWCITLVKQQRQQRYHPTMPHYNNRSTMNYIVHTTRVLAQVADCLYDPNLHPLLLETLLTLASLKALTPMAAVLVAYEERGRETEFFAAAAKRGCAHRVVYPTTGGDQSQSLNRNIPHPPTNRIPSIGICGDLDPNNVVVCELLLPSNDSV
eukprot:9482551-Pyramimonas_sp.AAC.1